MTAVTFKEKPVTLVGGRVEVGDSAPDFTVLANDMTPVSLSDASGKVRLISVVPSIDTGVCSQQTRKFNEEAASLENVEVWTISCDLPFAQRRWCAAEGIENVRVLSDHKDLDFGKQFGLVMDEMRLLARSVIVVDSEGKVSYKEIVSEGTNHPDYEAAINAANNTD
ncbi:lipid hydroperoxide peroxidase [Marinococcus halophilus]|uniref:Thiol peroxidase n=1 Tax=Marinococcus halophilus TaxID=1371 RepID=A0A510Y4S0_MARHA|nr:thiol peroxidase [Marinococcus halophilus]OZT79940.1 lipid hydroperoxide peroxidase [Marinococcus halophilus]GEK58143.1 putative thiol peroxidase [Marinococcus halophilus]